MIKRVLLFAVVFMSTLSQAQSTESSDLTQSSQVQSVTELSTKRFSRDRFDWEHGVGRDEWGSNNHHEDLFHPCEFFHPRFDRVIACAAIGHHEFGGYTKFKAYQRIRGRRTGSCFRAERRAAIKALERCEYATFGDICRVIKCVVK